MIVGTAGTSLRADIKSKRYKHFFLTIYSPYPIILLINAGVFG